MMEEKKSSLENETNEVLCLQRGLAVHLPSIEK